MAKRSSRQRRIGNAGETAVKLAFELLDWGVADNCRHDLGTDLFVAATDERAFDLGLIVGVQVKSGRSGKGGKYFGEPVRGKAQSDPTGWWFRDKDRSEIDAWLSHGLPHLLVLHDFDTHLSHWVHVRPEVVVPAGARGAKILIPRDQVVDRAQRADLLAVAASQRPRIEWEGSAWSGASSLLSRQLLRHALVVPRLVAPHANSTLDGALTAPQAVALLMRANLDDLARRLDLQPPRNDIGPALDRPGWQWRFARSLYDRLTTGSLSDPGALIESAPTPADRAAAVVVAAGTNIEDGAAEQALGLLDAAIARDDYDLVDRGWLALQRSRVLRDLGRLDEARGDALVAQQARVGQPDDLTSSAIGGTAAATVFSLSDWDEKGLAARIAGADTAAAWWRTLTANRGLTASVNRAFESWSHRQVVRWQRRDDANDDLVSAGLMASYLGDHAAWRHLSTLLGRDHLTQLTRHADPESVKSAMSTLRLAGDHEGLKQAARWMVRNGPAAAVANTADEVDPSAFSRTTARAGLVLLAAAGDVLHPPTAATAVRWLLDTIADPRDFVRRTTPTYMVERELVDVLARVVAAAPEAEQRAVARQLADLPAQGDQLYAEHWAELVRALPTSAWDAGTAQRMADGADRHWVSLEAAALAVGAAVDEGACERIVAMIERGAYGALAAFGDVRLLPSAVAAIEIQRLCARTDKIIDAAAQSSYGFGGSDVARDLALLNIWHPLEAQWDPLLAVLADARVVPERKNGALELLAETSSQLPREVVAELVDVAGAVAGHPRLPTGLGLTSNNALGPALDLLAALSGTDTPLVDHYDRVLALLVGDKDDRARAARLARRGADPAVVGLLVGLSRDEHPDVRASAASSLVDIIAARDADGVSDAGRLVDAALAHVIDDPGTAVGRGVAGALMRSGWTPPERVIQLLRQHQSARVRRFASQAFGTTAPDNLAPDPR